MNAFQDWPASDLESIAVPALVIVGDQDVVTAYDQSQNAFAASPAEFRYFDGATFR